MKHLDTLEECRFNINDLVLNKHQVCSSDFIINRWIETLLLPNLQSMYSPTEFLTSAIGFFQLLSLFVNLLKNI